MILSLKYRTLQYKYIKIGIYTEKIGINTEISKQRNKTYT